MAVAQLREAIIAGLEQTFPAKMGLEELVFGNAMETTFDTETIQIDKFEGTRGAAKYTARGAKGQTVGLEGWTTVSVTPPMIDENFVVTAQDLKTRDYGKSNINAPIGQKFQNIVNKQLGRLKDRKQRTYNENQIVGLLKTGKVAIVEYDDKGTAKPTRYEDFLMPTTHIYTVGTAWNAVGADIFGDMRTIDNLIAKNSGLTTTDAIVGETTLADMMADPTIQGLLDNRRINFGDIAMEDKGNGLTSWGILLGKRIWTFTEFDGSGNPLVPATSYMPFSNQAETDIYYASIDAMVDGMPTVVEGKEVIYNKADDNAVAVKQGFKSAKLYGLTQSAGFANITTR